MFFIFILLYIAIATILQLNNFDTKRFLTRLIIVALLINFSLFITNVVIDVSNVLAEGFYSGIVMDENGQKKGDISERFMKGLKLQSFYNTKTGDITDESLKINGTNIIAIGFFGSIFILITAFTFLAAAIMFVIRTAVLIILMVLSPIAFAGHILPKTEGYSKEWWNTLLAQSFFAPAYLIMVWVVMKVMEGGVKIKGENDKLNFAALAGSSDNVSGVIFSFAIIITLIMASLVVAKKVAASGSMTLTNAAGGAIGKVAGGAGGWAGRKFIGGGIDKFLTEERRKKMSQSFLGRRALDVSRMATTASYDVRGLPGASRLAKESGVDFGKAGGAGGYLAKQKEVEKKALKAMEAMRTPEEKEAYAEEQKTLISRLLHGKSKRTAGSIEGKISKVAQKDREAREIKQEKTRLTNEITESSNDLKKLRESLEELNSQIETTANGVKKTDVIVKKNNIIADINEKEQLRENLQNELSMVEKKEKENSDVRRLEKILEKAEKPDKEKKSSNNTDKKESGDDEKK